MIYIFRSCFTNDPNQPSHFNTTEENTELTLENLNQIAKERGFASVESKIASKTAQDLIDILNKNHTVGNLTLDKLKDLMKLWQNNPPIFKSLDQKLTETYLIKYIPNIKKFILQSFFIIEIYINPFSHLKAFTKLLLSPIKDIGSWHENLTTSKKYIEDMFTTPQKVAAFVYSKFIPSKYDKLYNFLAIPFITFFLLILTKVVQHVKPTRTDLLSLENITLKLKSWELKTPLIRNDVLNEIIPIIGDITKNGNNLLLIGHPGFGKTEIIRGLAHQINEGAIPSLKGAQLFYNSCPPPKSEDFAIEYLDQVFKQIQKFPNGVILVFDEFHQIAQSQKLRDYLKTQLESGSHSKFVQMIGLSTPKEIEKTLSSDPAFDMRFRRVDIRSPGRSFILRMLKEHLEKEDVLIEKKALETIVTLATPEDDDTQPCPRLAIQHLKIALSNFKQKKELKSESEEEDIKLHSELQLQSQKLKIYPNLPVSMKDVSERIEKAKQKREGDLKRYNELMNLQKESRALKSHLWASLKALNIDHWGKAEESWLKTYLLTVQIYIPLLKQQGNKIEETINAFPVRLTSEFVEETLKNRKPYTLYSSPSPDGQTPDRIISNSSDSDTDSDGNFSQYSSD